MWNRKNVPADAPRLNAPLRLLIAGAGVACLILALFTVRSGIARNPGPTRSDPFGVIRTQFLAYRSNPADAEPIIREWQELTLESGVAPEEGQAVVVSILSYGGPGYTIPELSAALGKLRRAFAARRGGEREVMQGVRELLSVDVDRRVERCGGTRTDAVRAILPRFLDRLADPDSVSVVVAASEIENAAAACVSNGVAQ